MGLQIPLLLSAIAFAAFMIFRFRPVVSTAGRASAVALTEAKQRIAAAQDDAARATALCDGCQNGANEAASRYVSCVASEPSAFAT